MAKKVDELQIELTALTTQFQASIEASTKRMNEMTAETIKLSERNSALHKKLKESKAQQKALTDSMKSGAAATKAITGDVRVLESAQAKLTSRVDRSTLSTIKNKAAIQHSGIGYQKMLNHVSQLRLGYFALAGAQALIIKGIVDSTMAYENLRFSMIAATGSIQNGAEAMTTSISIAQEFGLSLRETAASYSRLLVAANGSRMEGEATIKSFREIAQAARAYGLSNEDLGGSLKALEQMLSKGTVQLEELKNQLGDRLPGAMGIAARAMGMTRASLFKLIETGTLAADEFVPKFTAEMAKATAASVEFTKKSATAAFNRLTNSVELLEEAVGRSGLVDWMADFSDALAQIFDKMAGRDAKTTKGLERQLTLETHALRMQNEEWREAQRQLKAFQDLGVPGSWMKWLPKRVDEAKAEFDRLQAEVTKTEIALGRKDIGLQLEKGFEISTAVEQSILAVSTAADAGANKIALAKGKELTAFKIASAGIQDVLGKQSAAIERSQSVLAKLKATGGSTEDISAVTANLELLNSAYSTNAAELVELRKNHAIAVRQLDQKLAKKLLSEQKDAQRGQVSAAVDHLDTMLAIKKRGVEAMRAANIDPAGSDLKAPVIGKFKVPDLTGVQAEYDKFINTTSAKFSELQGQLAKGALSNSADEVSRIDKIVAANDKLLSSLSTQRASMGLTTTASSAAIMSIRKAKSDEVQAYKSTTAEVKASLASQVAEITNTRNQIANLTGVANAQRRSELESTLAALEYLEGESNATLEQLASSHASKMINLTTQLNDATLSADKGAIADRIAALKVERDNILSLRAQAGGTISTELQLNTPDYSVASATYSEFVKQTTATFADLNRSVGASPLPDPAAEADRVSRLNALNEAFRASLEQQRKALGLVPTAANAATKEIMQAKAAEVAAYGTARARIAADLSAQVDEIVSTKAQIAALTSSGNDELRAELESTLSALNFLQGDSNAKIEQLAREHAVRMSDINSSLNDATIAADVTAMNDRIAVIKAEQAALQRVKSVLGEGGFKKVTGEGKFDSETTTPDGIDFAAIEKQQTDFVAASAERFLGLKNIIEQTYANPEQTAERLALLGELELNYTSGLLANNQAVIDAKSSMFDQLLGMEDGYIKKIQNWDKQSATTKVSLAKQGMDKLVAMTGNRSKKLFKIQQAVDIASAIMNTGVGATKALAQGGFLGIGMAAAVIANGMAQVANIRKQKYTGGSGGSSAAGGGGGSSVGALDSFSTASGISQASTAVESKEQEPKRNVTIDFKGDDDQFISVRRVRELMKMINEQVEDGNTLLTVTP